MTNRWRALADRYLATQRVLHGNLLTRMKEDGTVDESELLTLATSRAKFAEFLELFVSGSGVTSDDLEDFTRPTSFDVAALKQLLYDVLHMHFVKVLAEDADFVPPVLIFEMVRGAVYTVNPSANRIWIERTVRADPKRVRDALLWFLEYGTSFEVGGAANAFYWFDVLSVDVKPEIDRARERRDVISLTRFVNTDDLDLRRCLVSKFSWNPRDYPEHMRALLQRAEAIASNHADHYIRQRFLCDTGKSPLIPCLPRRDLASVVE